MGGVSSIILVLVHVQRHCSDSTMESLSRVRMLMTCRGTTSILGCHFIMMLLPMLLNMKSSRPGQEEFRRRMSCPRVRPGIAIHIANYSRTSLILLFQCKVLPVMPKHTVTLPPNVSGILCLKWRTRCCEMQESQMMHSPERISYV